MDWSKIKTIYMIGIKGQGMTALAKLLADQGKRLSGSDVAESWSTQGTLEAIGAEIKVGWRSANVPKTVDLIIYSTSYNDNNEEVAAAVAGKVKTVTYPEAVADLFNQSWGVAVAGSHGKSTTTAWLGFVLKEAGLSPSVLVGATVPQFGGQGLTGQSNLLVLEADEYQNKLAAYSPKLAVLTSVDFDHPDWYPDRSSYEQAFADWLGRLTVKDKVVANFDDETVRRLCQSTKARVIGYGLDEGAEIRARQLSYQNGRQYFKVSLGADNLGDFSIQLAGRHNVSNALAVIAAALELEAELHRVREAVSAFGGVARRLEKLGEYKGAVIADDYAHHPTEIRATLRAARQLWPEKKLVLVFHPHTFSRSKALFHDFIDSLLGADEVVVLDIYGSAREVAGGVSSAELVEKMRLLDEDKAISHQPTLKEAAAYLRHHLQGNEVVLLMGAGDVFRIGEELLKT